MVSRLGEFGKIYFEKVSRDNIITHSAALAFYSTLTTTPLIILTLSLMKTFKLKAKRELLERSEAFLGEGVADYLSFLVQKTDGASDLSHLSNWGGALILLISGSIVFAHLQRAFNIIFAHPDDVKKKRGKKQMTLLFARRRLVTSLMVFAFILLAMSSLFLSSFLSVLFNEFLPFFGNMVHEFTSFILFFILFSGVFLVLPERRIGLKAGLWGGLITSVLFIIGKIFIAMFLSEIQWTSAYGAVGSVMIFLLWMYYSSIIFFLGAEVAALMNRLLRRPGHQKPVL